MRTSSVSRKFFQPGTTYCRRRSRAFNAALTTGSTPRDECFCSQPGAPATRAEPAIGSVHTLAPHPLPPQTASAGFASGAASRPEASRPELQRVVAPVAQPTAYAAAPPARVHATPRPYARSLTCCWPIGEPGTKTFRFCDDGAVAGKPYCTAHAALAYVKVRDRREDAA